MALPNYRISIVKKFGAEEWSNDYLVNAASLDAAATLASSLVEFEEAIHFDVVEFVYYRVSTTAVGDRTFRHVPINQTGTAESAGQSFLPLFNTFRMPIGESQQNGGILETSFITGATSAINDLLVPVIAEGAIVTSKGNVVTGATPYRFVQERQLKRRKRRAAP